MAISSPVNAPLERPGEVLLQHGLASDALPFLLESTRTEPSHWPNFLNLGIAYRYLGRFDECQQSLATAARLAPNEWPIYHTWANILDDIGQFKDALDLRWKAWELSKRTRREVALGLAVSLLRHDQWQKGWPFWEIGRYSYSWSPLPDSQVWKGENLAGKRILVMCEGGYGDLFDFSRWLPALVNQGATVTLALWERQIEILEHSPTLEGVSFMSLGSTIDPREFDHCTSILSIPAILNASPKDVPPPVVFELEPMNIKRNGERRLGLCWKAEENGAHRKFRSIPEQFIEPFKSVGADWYSLVPKSTLPWLKPSPDNWLDTARFIQTLDVVVTVDTAIGHLAGCLGKPVILMLCTNPEWRWGIGRADSPWYPNTRLVRATKVEEWTDVIEAAVKLL